MKNVFLVILNISNNYNYFFIMKNNNIINFIRVLPDDIVKLILYEYIEPYLILMQLNKILNSKKSKSLYCESLHRYLKNIVLNNVIVVKSLIKNNKIFCSIYDNHINKNEKSFSLIEDPIESMALSWLMYLYHKFIF